MKKLLFMIGLLSLASTTSFSQSQNWWKTDGTNTGSNSTYVGTSNNFALKFKSNNIEWFSISPTGIYQFNGLSGTTRGVLGVSSTGELFRTDLTGDANDIYRGDGTFGSISSMSGWLMNGNVLYSDLSKNVGIGTNIAPERLTVNGNIIANGSISGTSLNVVDIVTTGREFKISTSLCLKGIDANIPGSRNMICGLNGDLYVQSTNANYNTIINYGNTGKVGIGLIPTEDFHVGVKARFEGDVYMNKIIPTDSIFSIGENTLHFNTYYNTIYGSATGANGVNGTGFGSHNAFGIGVRSIAIGNRVRADGQNSIIIGQSNQATSAQFRNTIDNSLMIGFNSDIPTLTVLPASGTGTTGQIGIGTTCVPNGYSLAIKGKVIMEEGTVKLADVSGCWPDFVFEENYQRMNWVEKTIYIQNYKHLPYMPSANEVENSGLNIGTGMAAITQNVEENTLDILELFKKMEAMETEIERLKSENSELKEKIKN